jgi:hypothetical protein
MKLCWPCISRSALALLVGLGLASPCLAKFANVWEPVPLERLIRNVSRHVQRKPQDAEGQYTLGRLHSLAFVRGMTTASVTKNPLPLPGFAPWDSVLVKPEEGKQPTAAPLHLTESIRRYRRATELAPGKGLYWLGLGWMLEQGAPLAAKVNAPFLARPAKASAAQWRDRALAAYRRAYRLTLDEELKRESFLESYADWSISLEAGEGMIRLLKPQRLTAAQQAEVSTIRKNLKTLEGKPRAITPIIFPMDRPVSLSALLRPDRAVSFDLAGDGRPERWPWVGPDAGILVWDPEKTEKITSGRQLLGSVTWSMFWENGYKPLAALDDDRDGWLTGAELAGLAAWCDRNVNGVSDPGEVQPLVRLGIARVAVKALHRSEGVLHHPRGLVRGDGSSLPTYAWKPVSIPPGFGRPNEYGLRR